MIAPRNLGFHHFAGRFIARLDAGDALRPTAFEDQIAIPEAHTSVAMTYGPRLGLYEYATCFYRDPR
jgi:hypothetical protein